MILNKKIMKRGGKRVLFILVIVVLLAWTLLPMWWIIVTSLKTTSQIFTVPPPLIFKPTLKHWEAVLLKSDFLRFYRNSLIICTSVVALVLAIASIGAFSFSRFRYKGKETIANFILAQRMMPAAAVVLPIYVIYARLGILDTFRGLIFINLAFNLPVAVWMIRGFIDSIPIELEEAAFIDGCSRFTAFLRITLPLTLGGILATGVIVFIFTINEFFFAFILTGTRAVPVSVVATHYLPTGVRGTLHGNAAVASMLIAAPSLIFCIIVQKYLIRGMSMGVIKG